MRAQRPGAVLRLLFVVMLPAGSVLVATCRDATVPETLAQEQAVPLRPRTGNDYELTPENSEWKRRAVAADSADCHLKNMWFGVDSTNDGVNMVSCPVQAVVYPSFKDGVWPLSHEGGPEGWHDTIVVTFSRPVGMLAILSAGMHDCYVETYSRVVAYGPDSVELGRTTFRLLPVLCRDVSDPGWQMKTREVETASQGQKPKVSSLVSGDASGPYAEAVLRIPSGVTRLTIAPPEQWGWRWVNPPPSGYWTGGGEPPFADLLHQGSYDIIFRAAPRSGPALRTTCTPRVVVRGSGVTCTVGTTENTPFERVKWQFTSTDSIMPGFSLVDSSAGTTWNGTVVLSGIIRATALLQGQELSAADTVLATARDWSSETVPYTIKAVPSPSPDPPDTVADLGANLPIPSVRHELARVIATGPNAGLVYFAAIPYRLSFEVSFNAQAMRVGSAFYGMQPRTEQTVGGIRYCARSRVVSDTVAVKRHEGFSMADENSHTQVMWRVFTDYVRPRAERLVGDDRLDVIPLMNLADSVARKETRRVTDLQRTTNPYQTDCQFNYNPSLRFR